MRCPLARPGGLFHQVIKGVARHLGVGITGVVTELIEIGIGLIGNALAVAIDVDAGKCRGLDGVTTQFPDLIQCGIGRAEMCGIVLPSRSKCRAPTKIACGKCSFPAFDLDPPKGQHDAPFFGCQDRRGLRGIASVRCRSHASDSTLCGDFGLCITNRATGSTVDASILRGLAEMHGEFLRLIQSQQFEVSKSDLTKIDEDRAIGESFCGDRILRNEMRGRGAEVRAECESSEEAKQFHDEGGESKSNDFWRGGRNGDRPPCAWRMGSKSASMPCDLMS